MALLPHGSNYKLIPTSIFGLLNICHFAYTWIHQSSTTYPFPQILSRIPELCIIIIVVVVILLHIVTGLVTRTDIDMRRILPVNISLNEDFAIALFKLGTACLEKTSNLGLMNEMEPFIIQEGRLGSAAAASSSTRPPIVPSLTSGFGIPEVSTPDNSSSRRGIRLLGHQRGVLSVWIQFFKMISIFIIKKIRSLLPGYRLTSIPIRNNTMLDVNVDISSNNDSTAPMSEKHIISDEELYTLFKAGKLDDNLSNSDMDESNWEPDEETDTESDIFSEDLSDKLSDVSSSVYYDPSSTEFESVPSSMSRRFSDTHSADTGNRTFKREGKYGLSSFSSRIHGNLRSYSREDTVESDVDVDSLYQEVFNLNRDNREHDSPLQPISMEIHFPEINRVMTRSMRRSLLSEYSSHGIDMNGGHGGNEVLSLSELAVLRRRQRGDSLNENNSQILNQFTSNESTTRLLAKKLCVVCQSQERNIALRPCGYVC